ncbi:MAG: type VI secretion system baseplate subunit TssK [Lentisphaerae bacterium]|nr:type VI secretion system baseplate subunit TssK [Lentisphaerota bacterium]MCP4100687.1 type VI secretion system baseplate subunit TssK [Lentisphaerota bacterium]
MFDYIENVNWHEGLFLRPHNMQLADRADSSARRSDRSLAIYYPYGLSELKISEDALGGYNLRIESIAAIMPGGLEVRSPGNTSLTDLDLRSTLEEAQEKFKVYLAVPLIRLGEMNTGRAGEEGKHRLCRYQSVVREIDDENDGGNPQPLLTRKVNARLLTDYDSLDDYEVLPIVELRKISEGTETPHLEISQEYIAPCLTMRGSPDLRRMTEDLVERLQLTRDELISFFRRSGYNPETLSSIQIEKMMRLRSIGSVLATLRPKLRLKSTTPFTVYMEMNRLLCELAALSPQHNFFDIPDYDHDNCRGCFVELFSRIRSLTAPDTSGGYVKVNLKKVPDACLLTGELEDRYINNTQDYFLAVSYRDNPQTIVNLVEAGDKFKFTAASIIDSRVRGVKLKEERYPPSLLPQLNNALWFRLMRTSSSRAWSKILEEKKFALAWSAKELPNIEVSLYAILFAEKEVES